jgi:hypothetical protein
MTRFRSDPAYTLALTSFADSHRLTTVRGGDERYVQGRDGLLAEYSRERLHLLLTPGTGNAGWWNNRRRAAIAAGMTLDQDGDTEGSLIFDPSDAKQTAAAIRLSGCRQRRAITEKERAGLLERLQRRKVPENGTKTGLKTTIARQGSNGTAKHTTEKMEA